MLLKFKRRLVSCLMCQKRSRTRRSSNRGSVDFRLVIQYYFSRVEVAFTEPKTLQRIVQANHEPRGHLCITVRMSPNARYRETTSTAARSAAPFSINLAGDHTAVEASGEFRRSYCNFPNQSAEFVLDRSRLSLDELIERDIWFCRRAGR